MKHINTLFFAFCLGGMAQAQTNSTFEEVTLAPTSYYNGDNFDGGFNSGNAFFHNVYDTTWGASAGYWAEGWALTNIYDTVTQPSSFGQLYNVKELTGYAGSVNTAIGTQGSRIVLTGAAAGKGLHNVYITNSTFAYNSMKLGDAFAKKFGGATGNDPDYFKLVIYKYDDGVLGADSVEFYLADYRFADNSLDYIVKQWTLVDLHALGDVDSLEFIIRSSDVGSFGINTPLYFCIDNFRTADVTSGLAENENEISLDVYPNPFTSRFTIRTDVANATATITGITGNVLQTINFSNLTTVNMETYPAGVYILNVNGVSRRIVKQ